MMRGGGGLELGRPCGWWSEAVRAVAWQDADGADVPAVALLGPELDEGALARARDRASPWLARRERGVVPLLGVSDADGRSAWVYGWTEGVSLGLVLAAPGDPIPVRAAAELVAACAEVLEGVGPEALHHPGPEPDDVLLLPDGTVRLAGFVGPFARSPARREPHGAEDGAALVWRLGVLLAQALTQAPPPPATDRASHEAMLRRLLIKVMSRPGPTFPGRLRDWLVGMLSWDADERPVLARVGPGLREVASAMPEPGLARWCAAHVLALRARSDHGDPFRAPEPPLDSSGSIDLPVTKLDQTEDLTLERPVESLADPPDIDDTTVISVEGEAPQLPRREWERERGSIPVQVGPPPQAVPRATRLPEELFAPTPPPLPREPSGFDPLARRALLGFALFLTVVGVLVSWYLFA
jgi:hypothetical protein